MGAPSITVLEGSTFCVSGEAGDIAESHEGFFFEDARFLSRFALTIDGQRLPLLSSGRVDYYSAAFWLRNPVSSGLEADELSISRRRFVSPTAMQEQIEVASHANRRLAFTLAVELESDFADIFAVKEYDLALGDPAHAHALPDPADPVIDVAARTIMFEDASGYPARTWIVPSRWTDIHERALTYEIELRPHERWRLVVDIVPSTDDTAISAESVEMQFGEELGHVRASLAAWKLSVPQLRASWDDLQHAYTGAVSDIASLRMSVDMLGQLPAAGVPWFMTVFGRDTLITSLQTLLFGPELAETALRVLAELQATEDRPDLDAEPGKIVHEIRRGKTAEKWFGRYYGTVDATPLYLILLSEVWRWTGHDDLVTSLREPALRCLEWIDEYGDVDGDGFVEFRRRSGHGLGTQSWKDSWNSQLFTDATLAEAPIAPCEVQGYVYDAKRRTAELAREVWRDRDLAERLERDATALSDRFDAAFWCEERGGYFALGLDRDKRRIDSLTSNIGHLLWSGIVKPERVDATVDQLMGEPLWSGWGVRTMSTGDAGYNPLAYHNGTVWPHDNSLVAWGLARYGRWPEAHRIVRRMLGAASYFDHRLPEVFAGFPRSETPFPVRYPTASSPQAWAAGTAILLLQILLGLEPDPSIHALKTHAPELPAWAGRIRLRNTHAFNRHWDVTLEKGRVRVEESVRPLASEL